MPSPPLDSEIQPLTRLPLEGCRCGAVRSLWSWASLRVAVRRVYRKIVPARCGEGGGKPDAVHRSAGRSGAGADGRERAIRLEEKAIYNMYMSFGEVACFDVALRFPRGSLQIACPLLCRQRGYRGR